MELLIEAPNKEKALILINDKYQNIVIGSEEFGCRNICDFNRQDIEELVKQKHETKIWIKINSFIFEQDIENLTNYLKWLASIDIDYVIFQDYAIAQINHELNLNLNLHYNPETINTNYAQLEFFNQNKFTGCFIARELMINELEEICAKKSNMKIEIQAFGLGLIMHSRWSLISNFEKYYNKKTLANNYMEIKEELRKVPNIIFEDKNGSHMFTGYVLNLISLLPKLKSIGVDLLQINLLKLPESFFEIIPIYKDALIDLDNNNFDLEKYESRINKIIDNKFILSKGFLGGLKEIKHLIKEDGSIDE
ncbi:MAG: U32 family peptidase [Mycoplasma sp.]